MAEAASAAVAPKVSRLDRALRDTQAGQAAGRFSVPDAEIALPPTGTW